MALHAPPPRCITINQLAHFLEIADHLVRSYIRSDMLPRAYKDSELPRLGWRRQHLLDYFSLNPLKLKQLIERARPYSANPRTGDQLLAYLKEQPSSSRVNDIQLLKLKLAELEKKREEAEKRKVGELRTKIATIEAALVELGR